MKTGKNLVKDMGRIAFWYPFRWIARLLPFRAIGVLGAAMGRADRAVSRAGRTRLMVRNIADAFGGDRDLARRILLANLQNHGMDMIEFMKYPQMNPERCRRLVQWEGRDQLDQAIAKGKGVLLCTAHFGAPSVFAE